jgi:predicted Zn-dependent protease
MSSPSQSFANFLDYQYLESSDDLLGIDLPKDSSKFADKFGDLIPNLSRDDLTGIFSTALDSPTGESLTDSSLLNFALNRTTDLASTTFAHIYPQKSSFLGSFLERISPSVTALEPAAAPVPRAAFTTLAANGQRFENNNDSDGKALKWTRASSKPDGTQATTITFAFDDNFKVSGLDTGRAKTLFADALQTWANYAPLEFVEIKDPGSADAVDIFAESKLIDGAGQTLALAYFPTVGDISFDTGETWSELLFLETAVHELGHTLGLDHEDDTTAIMNSIYADRFASTGKPFLFQDDINGIRALYGTGSGSVKTLGNYSPSAPGSAPSSNLVTNGSFEEVPLKLGESARYRQVKGWSTIDGVGFEVQRRPATAGRAAEGTAWVELDTLGRNNTIGQNIDTITGQAYIVSVDFSDGGRPESTTSAEVFWEGRKIDTISGGGKGLWRNFRYEVRGGDRDMSTLAFRAMGPSDNVGGFIDNISVIAKPSALMQAEITLGSASAMPVQDLRSGLQSAPSLFASDSLPTVDYSWT